MGKAGCGPGGRERAGMRAGWVSRGRSGARDLFSWRFSLPVASAVRRARHIRTVCDGRWPLTGQPSYLYPHTHRPVFWWAYIDCKRVSEGACASCGVLNVMHATPGSTKRYGGVHACRGSDSMRKEGKRDEDAWRSHHADPQRRRDGRRKGQVCRRAHKSVDACADHRAVQQRRSQNAPTEHAIQPAVRQQRRCVASEGVQYTCGACGCGCG